ncbi:hypothetical protein FOZ62_010826, partial [Perkinsus olseni]
HEENRKRRVEMQRLGDEKTKEAVDNKNVGSILKTLALVYSLVGLARMRELLTEKRMKDTSEAERSEAASRIQRYYRRWIRTCRVGKCKEDQECKNCEVISDEEPREKWSDAPKEVHEGDSVVLGE